jgi:excisionase family DNA binding protein
MPRPPKTNDRDWMSTPEVAKLFGVSLETVRTWIKAGKLEAENVNGYYRVPKKSATARAEEMFGAL